MVSPLPPASPALPGPSEMPPISKDGPQSSTTTPTTLTPKNSSSNLRKQRSSVADTLTAAASSVQSSNDAKRLLQMLNADGKSAENSGDIIAILNEFNPGDSAGRNRLANALRKFPDALSAVRNALADIANGEITHLDSDPEHQISPDLRRHLQTCFECNRDSEECDTNFTMLVQRLDAKADVSDLKKGLTEAGNDIGGVLKVLNDFEEKSIGEKGRLGAVVGEDKALAAKLVVAFYHIMQNMHEGSLNPASRFPDEHPGDLLDFDWHVKTILAYPRLGEAQSSILQEVKGFLEIIKKELVLNAATGFMRASFTPEQQKIALDYIEQWVATPEYSLRHVKEVLKTDENNDGTHIDASFMTIEKIFVTLIQALDPQKENIGIAPELMNRYMDICASLARPAGEIARYRSAVTPDAINLLVIRDAMDRLCVGKESEKAYLAKIDEIAGNLELPSFSAHATARSIAGAKSRYDDERRKGLPEVQVTGVKTTTLKAKEFVGQYFGSTEELLRIVFSAERAKSTTEAASRRITIQNHLDLHEWTHDNCVKFLELYYLELKPVERDKMPGSTVPTSGQSS